MSPQDGTYYGSTTTGSTPRTPTDLTVPSRRLDQWTPRPGDKPEPPTVIRRPPPLTLLLGEEPDIDTQSGQVPSYLLGPADMQPDYMQRVPTNLTSYPTTWRPSPWARPTGQGERSPMTDYYANRAGQASGTTPRPTAPVEPSIGQQPYGQTYSKLNYEQGSIANIDDRDADDKLRVLMGYETFAGTTGAVDYDVTLSVREATSYTMLPTAMQEKVADLTRRYYSGMSPQMAWIEKRWAAAVKDAAERYTFKGEKVSPFQVYDQMLSVWKASGRGPAGSTSGGGGGYGSYGGGGGGSSQVVLTSAEDARVVLNQAMSGFLGRQATASEVDSFVALLNAKEMANPMTTTFEGDIAVQSGGFNPDTFAMDYAQGMEGSSEYQVATTFMDALMQAMSQDTGVL